MLRVTVHGPGVPTIVLGAGESLLFGRAPQAPGADLGTTILALPDCAGHVSRLVGELVIGEEMVRLRWCGETEAQLSSLFDAPAGARRVALGAGMSALLDEGENHVLLLRGRRDVTDLLLVVDVAAAAPAPVTAPQPGRYADPDAVPTGPAPGLPRGSREWFVALALAEPWLSGTDDYPRPPSNREIYERVLGWHGYAWNLERSQRVDDAIRAIARIAFGPRDDPFTAAASGRMQNVRFAVGRRTAEVRLVTPADLEEVLRSARNRAR